MRHLIRLSVAACALVLGAATLPAEGRKDDKGPFSDEMFVSMAASGGMHEVALGKLAQSNGQRDDVKTFGKRMVTDHSKANKELMEVAKAAGLTVPSQMMEKHQKHVEHFSMLRGAEFDREYIAHMTKDHEEDVALFEKASKQARNQDLKAFAEKTLPTLKEHLAMIKKIGGDQPSDK